MSEVIKLVAITDCEGALGKELWCSWWCLSVDWEYFKLLFAGWFRISRLSDHLENLYLTTVRGEWILCTCVFLCICTYLCMCLLFCLCTRACTFLEACLFVWLCAGGHLCLCASVLDMLRACVPVRAFLRVLLCASVWVCSYHCVANNAFIWQSKLLRSTHALQ